LKKEGAWQGERLGTHKRARIDKRGVKTATKVVRKRRPSLFFWKEVNVCRQSTRRTERGGRWGEEDA